MKVNLFTNEQKKKILLKWQTIQTQNSKFSTLCQKWQTCQFLDFFPRAMSEGRQKFAMQISVLTKIKLT